MKTMLMVLVSSAFSLVPGAGASPDCCPPECCPIGCCAEAEAGAKSGECPETCPPQCCPPGCCGNDRG